MSARKKLILLHSNDFHGDFHPAEKDGKLTGGLSLLSGYVKKTRAQEENVLYAIAGDLFRGSVIDAEYRGLSTIELVNALAPDVVALGNHEVDYGLGHLLFLERCAKFPVINANMYIRSNGARLFPPFKIIHVHGINVLFIGVITEEVLSSTKAEAIIGTYVDVCEAAEEIGRIIDNYKTVKIDLTVLLTHIGYKEDRKLAELLDPNWGIDLIIGAHSHTLLTKAKVVNGIPIVQAGWGSKQIGKITCEIDTEQHKALSLDYEVVPVDEDTSEKDPLIEELLDAYQKETDEKYSRILTTLKRPLTHPSRSEESELGNLFADLMQQDSSFEIMLFGSGSLRKKVLGPLVRYGDLKEALPFSNSIYMLSVTGRQFKDMCHHFLKQTVLTGGSSEFYSVSKGVRLVYDSVNDVLEECSLNGEEIADDRILKIALPEFHYNSFAEFFGVPLEEVVKNARARMVVTNDASVYEELFMTSSGLDAHVEGRVVIRK